MVWKSNEETGAETELARVEHARARAPRPALWRGSWPGSWLWLWLWAVSLAACRDDGVVAGDVAAEGDDSPGLTQNSAASSDVGKDDSSLPSETATGAGEGSGTTAVDDASSESDADDTEGVDEESYCACLRDHAASLPPRHSCTYRMPPAACDGPADCCPPAETLPPGFVCNRDAPYLYACHAGRCEPRNCDDDAQCVLEFELRHAPLGFRNLGCTEAREPCETEPSRRCRVDAFPESCRDRAECCPSDLAIPKGFGFECNVDYPFTYACDGGECRHLDCQADAQCDDYFRFSALAGQFENLGCVESERLCTGQTRRRCEMRELSQLPPCDVPEDCCGDAVPEGFECNRDWPFLFDCREGRCVERECADDLACERYFELELAGSGYENHGCVATPVQVSELLDDRPGLVGLPARPGWLATPR